MKQKTFFKKSTYQRSIIFYVIIIAAFFFLFQSCKQEKKQLPQFTSKDISHVIIKMTDLMVHDITNPPLAARFFSYACLAGYEVVSENDSSKRTMHGILNDYPEIKKPVQIKNYDYQLSALLAMMETAKKMQPSGRLFEEYENHFLDSIKNDTGIQLHLLFLQQ